MRFDDLRVHWDYSIQWVTPTTEESDFKVSDFVLTAGDLSQTRLCSSKIQFLASVLASSRSLKPHSLWCFLRHLVGPNLSFLFRNQDESDESSDLEGNGAKVNLVRF